ncbi:MAG TPA: hypothetical protein DEH78_01605, partial [Solibacterales bacterium]|nr:hypothetical protein [Bryobacterales bacterium]
MQGMRLLAGFVFVAAPLAAQHGSSAEVNPFTGPQHVAAGAAIYKGKCAGCHGPEGTGTGAGPALNTGTFRRGGTDQALFQVISRGVPGTAMPAFPANALEVWQSIAYLRSLSLARVSATGRGDAQAGAALFREHCAECHTNTAPDLRGIGRRRAESELREAILRPDLKVAPAYWQVRARTAAGAEIRGTRLNEDTHSLQLRGGGGVLLSLRKKDLSETELIRRSPMPSFEGKLTPAQLDHLLAFLASGQEIPAPPARVTGDVTAERLRNAAAEPHNWLTYNGTYSSIHHSSLEAIRPENVKGLELKWVWQANSLEKLEATPLVVDGVMYLTDAPNDVVALDARTGRVFWRYDHVLPEGVAPCCGRVNRGLAILGGTLFLATLDARLIALDASTGRKRWDTVVADYREAYSLTLAPLVAGGMVIVGPAGGE